MAIFEDKHFSKPLKDSVATFIRNHTTGAEQIKSCALCDYSHSTLKMILKGDRDLILENSMLIEDVLRRAKNNFLKRKQEAKNRHVKELLDKLK